MQQTKAKTSGAPGAWSATDRQMMTRALELAAQGVGRVSPGPLVGCVIVASGEIVGEGYYVYEEVNHAETLALEQAGATAKGAIAFVSLEPHAHHGRTPPCTDALIAAGIGKVIAPIDDPNPKVFGRGFDHLRSAGIEVRNGLMAREASRLNEKYLHFMKTGRPFVHLKMATSLDGKIATRTGDSRWITGAPARARVHELRHEYDAILVGAGTALSDNPLLTDRSGRPRRRPLVRVVLDDSLQLSTESELARTAKQAPVIVFAGASSDKTKIAALESQGVEVVIDHSNGRDLFSVLEQMGRRELQSVLVEGGASIAGKMLEAELVNKVTFFMAPLIVGGRESPNAVGGKGVDRINDALRLVDVDVVQRGNDFEITGYPATASNE